MKHPLWLLAASWLATQTFGSAQDIDIDRDARGPRLIPVTIEGLSGEILAALRFDLEIQGFEITAGDKAQYLISGQNSASLVGRVSDRINKASLLAKEYTGGSSRAQAHAFADDIVERLAQRKGISRTKIAFRVKRGENSEICFADYDGYNVVQVTQDNTINRDPAWLPGRRILLYTSYKDGNPDIYLHDLPAGTRRPFARFPGSNAGAAVSPDGRRVAMVLGKGGSPDIYVCDIEGGNLKQLTRTREDESSPCWSPDSQTLCFSSRSGGYARLFRISASGGGAMRQITTAGIGGNLTEPDWSPDGSTIVFTSSVGGFSICTVSAGGGSVTNLFKGEDPSWAPNSRTVAFTRRVGEARVVSLLDVPSKRVKDVRRVSGSSSQPSWAR